MSVMLAGSALGTAGATSAVANPRTATPAQTQSRPPPATVFVQVSSLEPYSPAAIGSWMAQLCADKTNPARSLAAGDVVLQDVAGPDGILATRYLDVIAPYLPGGTRACFKRAFVGTVDLTWRGAGSKYVEGVESGAFQKRYVAISDKVARAFVARYPNLQTDWYLTYEANLNDLSAPRVERAYRAMLGAEMQQLAAIRPHRAVMWSPAFWYPYSSSSTDLVGMDQLKTQLVDLFSSLRKTAGGLQVLNLQDFVAGSGCEPGWNRVTPQDVVGWVGFVAGMRQVSTVEVNVEQYTFDCANGGIHAGNPQEITAREAFYIAHHLTLGPAFEIRYWMQVRGMPLGT